MPDKDAPQHDVPTTTGPNMTGPNTTGPNTTDDMREDDMPENDKPDNDLAGSPQTEPAVTEASASGPPAEDPAGLVEAEVAAAVAEFEDDEVLSLAEETAREASSFLTTVTEVAAGTSPDFAIPVLLLATSQMLSVGARLGAISDIVPRDRFEADPGSDVDVDPLRHGLANLFEGLDTYAHVVDPLLGVDVVSGALSDDLAEIASELSHGLQHFAAGRPSEALWWWQFSFLSSWGDSAARVLRALLAVLGHIRLDVDEDTVAEAEFDALHP